jgi:hypothetical protein
MQCLKAGAEEPEDTAVAREQLSRHAPTATDNKRKTVGLDSLSVPYQIIKM